MKKIILATMLLLTLGLLVSCGKDAGEETTEETVVITNGYKESAQDFVALGMLIDVNESSKISGVTYEIRDLEVAVVSFVYDGLECEFLASTKRGDFDLAGDVSQTLGGVQVGSIGGNAATYYTMTAGRVVFWDDGYVYYCLHVLVTAKDEYVEEILNLLTYENHYSERAEASAEIDDESVAFAKKIIIVVKNKDLEGLAELMYYPQQLGNGVSAASKRELLSADVDDVFTERLLEEITDSSIYGLRVSSTDDTLYLIGSSTRNIYFRKNDDGEYEIVKFNNE